MGGLRKVPGLKVKDPTGLVALNRPQGPQK